MNSFLLVYDRLAGQVLTFKEFSSNQRYEALQARFAAEAEHRDRPEIEVVVLGAENVAALRTTHSRYFIGGSRLPEPA